MVGTVAGMTEPVQPRPARLRLWLAGAAVVVVALATGGAWLLLRDTSTGLEALRKKDPNGAHACGQLGSWLLGKATDATTGKPYNKAVVSLAVGSAGAKASTPGIKQAAGVPAFDDKAMGSLGSVGYQGGNMQFADLEKMHAACRAAGVKMPEYREP